MCPCAGSTIDPSGYLTRSVTRIYQHFNLPGRTPELDNELARLDKSQQARTSGHQYSQADFGLTEERIRAELAPVFEKYRFP